MLLLLLFVVIVVDVDDVVLFVHVQSIRIDMNVKKKGKQANKQRTTKQASDKSTPTEFLMPLKKKSNKRETTIHTSSPCALTEDEEESMRERERAREARPSTSVLYCID